MEANLETPTDHMEQLEHQRIVTAVKCSKVKHIH